MNTLEGIIFLLITLAVSITCHEFMHAFVSDQLGDDTARHSGRLSLNPLAHIDPFGTVLLPLFLFIAGLPVFGAAKPVPFNPYRLRYGEWGSALVAAAGPLTNLGLAAFVSLWLRFLPVAAPVTDFFEVFIVVNIGFFVFNLIPFPPLDGSRVLYAIVPQAVKNVMRQIESYGLAGIMIFIFILFPFISPIMRSAMRGLIGLLIPGLDASF